MFGFLREETDNSENSAKRIAYLEQKYGISFPDILRQLYAATDSRRIKKCEITVDGVSYYPTRLVLLDGVGANFEFVADDDRVKPMCDIIPSDWYPLASDDGGNYFYWSSISHSVYYIYSDAVEKKKLIAQSIEDFFELLNKSIIKNN